VLVDGDNDDDDDVFDAFDVDVSTLISMALNYYAKVVL
jgi:hypothetical protein